jgi:ABC-type antimicrobial peptide transport system permease subunit
LGLLGLVALALASLGVYAIVSQSVQERTREIGVRVAVGALPRQVASLVLRDTLTLTAAGIVIGLGVAAGAGRVLTGLLYNVQPADPLTLSAMAALFLSVSTAAVLLPVWRATRVDPVRALRQP